MICVGLCIDHVNEALKSKAKQNKANHLSRPLPALMAEQVGVARFPLYSMLNPSSASHPSLPSPSSFSHKSTLFSGIQSRIQHAA